jgi:hypothetical protein
METTIICNSCGCIYNNGEGGCILCEIEVRDGTCESFEEVAE